MKVRILLLMNMGKLTNGRNRLTGDNVVFILGILLQFHYAVKQNQLNGDLLAVNLKNNNVISFAVMSCLLDAMPDLNIPMNSECRKSLKERSELWGLSVKVCH